MDHSVISKQQNVHDLMYPGHGFCAGCSVPIVLKHVFREIGKDAVLVVTAGCLGSNNGVFPTSPMQLPTYNAPFPALGAAASGIRAGLDVQGRSETQVIAIGGDGGVFDIGLQALSGSLERNDDILFICYDNEAFMNTGVQRSSASPIGTITTTTPDSQPELRPKKNILEIIASHGIPYAATASVGYLEDMIIKIKKARDIRYGPRFLHIFSPCPVGWRYPGQMTNEIARMVVKTRLFPLYEVEEGQRYQITLEPELILSLEDYLKSQGRFRSVSRHQIDQIQEKINSDWENLIRKAKQSDCIRNEENAGN